MFKRHSCERAVLRLHPILYINLLFHLCSHRVNKEGYTPVNAACLNCRLKCLKQLVKYGGLLERVSAAQSESAFESTQKTGQRKLIEMVNQLKKEASTDHIYSAVNHNRQVR